MHGCEQYQINSIFIREMSEQQRSYRNYNNNNRSSSSSSSNIQHFIDHEQTISRQQHSSGNVRDETVRNRVDFRTLRCFCGCTSLSHEQIENFAMMNISALITHPTGSTLFRNFLQIGHRTKSEALIIFECHEMCGKYLQNLHLIHDQSNVDQLMNLCPSFTWEQRIENAIQSGNDNQIIQTLKNLQQECVNSIECLNDYDRFRRELLRKIGR